MMALGLRNRYGLLVLVSLYFLSGFFYDQLPYFRWLVVNTMDPKPFFGNSCNWFPLSKRNFILCAYMRPKILKWAHGQTFHIKTSSKANLTWCHLFLWHMSNLKNTKRFTWHVKIYGCLSGLLRIKLQYSYLHTA